MQQRTTVKRGLAPSSGSPTPDHYHRRAHSARKGLTMTLAYILIALLGFLVFLVGRQADRTQARLEMLIELVTDDIQKDEEDEE